MRASEETCGRVSCIGILAIAVTFSMPAQSANSEIDVHESTFEDLLDALEPVTFSGRYVLQLGWLTICASDYEGEAEDFDVQITSDGIRIEADITASWCSLNFGSGDPELTAEGDLSYHPPSGTLRVTFDSVVYRPKIDAFGTTITLPVSVDMASMLNVPPIPFQVATISFELPDGTRYMRMRAENVEVQHHDNHITIQTLPVVQ